MDERIRTSGGSALGSGAGSTNLSDGVDGVEGIVGAGVQPPSMLGSLLEMMAT